MRSVVFITLFVLLSVINLHAEIVEAVFVWSKDGTKIGYVLQSTPKMTFSSTDLIITSDNLEIKYPLDKLPRFTFEKTENASVSEIFSDVQNLFKITNHSIEFTNLSENIVVKIYSLDGMILVNESVREGGSHSISLDSLNCGLYVVSVNGITYKIVKK